MTTADPDSPHDPAERPAVPDTYAVQERTISWRVWGLIALGVMAVLLLLILNSPRLHPRYTFPPCDLVQLHTPRAVLCP